MKADLYFLLLAGLTAAATGLFQKVCVYIQNHSLNWTNAQKYCRDNYEDLLVLSSQIEYDDFKKIAANKTEFAWIGINKKSDETTFTQWCNGNQVTITDWDINHTSDPYTHNCVAVSSYGWMDYDCEKQLNFYCLTWQPKVIVVLELKTWKEALEHCRTLHTDLITPDTYTDQYLVKKYSLKIQTPFFWTGLSFLHGTWFWVNKDTLETLTMPSCPARPFLCGAQNNITNALESRDCEEKMNFMCYKESV